MEEVIGMYPNDMIWITGDVNLPHVGWESNVVQHYSYPAPYMIFYTFQVFTHILSLLISKYMVTTYSTSSALIYQLRLQLARSYLISDHDMLVLPRFSQLK